MRLSLLCLCLIAAAPVQARQAPREPYHGLWGSTAKACRPEAEGVHMMEVNPNGFYWYETRCKAGSITRTGPNTWRARLACEGEGERFRARSRLTLAAPNKLVIEDAPVTPTKLQSYVRCPGR